MTILSEKWLIQNGFYFTYKYMRVAYTNGEIDLLRDEEPYWNVAVNGFKISKTRVATLKDLNITLIFNNFKSLIVPDKIYSEEVTVEKTNNGYSVCVQHKESGSAYGFDISFDAYEQLTEIIKDKKYKI